MSAAPGSSIGLTLRKIAAIDFNTLRERQPPVFYWGEGIKRGR
jgi:hypothetical protein